MSRLLTRAQAAKYCELAPSSFDDWMRKGKVPRPLPGTRRWDSKALDRALDQLSGLTANATPEDDFDRWLREEGRHAG